MKTRMIVLLSLLAIVMVAYVFSMPEPAPMSTQEKAVIDAEIAKKIEWSDHGNITTGVLPIVEIPKKNPIFRIVRVFNSGTSKSGYSFKEDYLGMEFRWSMDIGEIIRNHDRARREKTI